MDDIAGQAGLSTGALSLYYKDAVIAALLKRFFTQEFIHLQRFGTWRAENVPEQLLLLTRQIFSAMQWMEKLMPIAFEFSALAGRNLEVRQFLRQYFQDYRAGSPDPARCRTRPGQLPWLVERRRLLWSRSTKD